MATTKLTKRNIDSLYKSTLASIEAQGKKDAILWDEELTGLGLRIGKSGKASWLVSRRFGQGGRKAKQIETVFGTLGEIPDPDKAREKARPIIEAIRNGANPNQAKQEKRSTDIDAFTNGKLEPLLTDWQTKKPKKGYYAHEVGRMIKADIVPTLGANTLVRDITKRNVHKLLDSKSQAVSRSLFAILRPFFNWCVDREVIEKSPIATMQAPCRVDARDRVLTDAELALVWHAANALSYPWRPFYRLLILTAQRRDEVAAVPWTELDLPKREWIIPGARTKNGKEHLVHLSPLVVSTLEELGANWEGLVLTTRSIEREDGTLNETPISGFSKAKLQLDAQIKKLNQGKDIAPWRIHDLRRTAATGMGSLGVQPHIVERILNHISGVNAGIVGIYQRFEYVNERREALRLWSEHIQELTKKDSDKPYNVFTLRVS